MNHFGLPLVPSALLLWVTNFSDRFFLVERLVDVVDRTLVVDHRLRSIRQSWPQTL